MTAEERAKEGSDMLMSIGYLNGELFQFGITKEESEKGEFPQELDNKMPFIVPLIASIHAWQHDRKH